MAFSSHLQEAIKSTTLEHLQTVLLSMCSKSEEVSRLASNELLVENSTVKVPKPYDDHPQLPKEVCAQCREEFVPALNKSDSCQWHDGKNQHLFITTYTDSIEANWNMTLTGVIGMNGMNPLTMMNSTKWSNTTQMASYGAVVTHLGMEESIF
jgi:hypothetical protein